MKIDLGRLGPAFLLVPALILAAGPVSAEGEGEGVRRGKVDREIRRDKETDGDNGVHRGPVDKGPREEARKAPEFPEDVKDLPEERISRKGRQVLERRRAKYGERRGHGRHHYGLRHGRGYSRRGHARYVAPVVVYRPSRPRPPVVETVERAEEDRRPVLHHVRPVGHRMSHRAYNMLIGRRYHARRAQERAADREAKAERFEASRPAQGEVRRGRAYGHHHRYRAPVRVIVVERGAAFHRGHGHRRGGHAYGSRNGGVGHRGHGRGGGRRR